MTTNSLKERPALPDVLRCGRTVMAAVASVALAVALLGGIVDHWTALMRWIASSYWTNTSLAGAAATLAFWQFCIGSQIHECSGKRRHPFDFGSAILLSSGVLTSLLAVLLACAISYTYPSFGDLTVTQWMASTIIWGAGIFAFFLNAVTLGDYLRADNP